MKPSTVLNLVNTNLEKGSSSSSSFVNRNETVTKILFGNGERIRYAAKKESKSLEAFLLLLLHIVLYFFASSSIRKPHIRNTKIVPKIKWNYKRLKNCTEPPNQVVFSIPRAKGQQMLEQASKCFHFISWIWQTWRNDGFTVITMTKILSR